MKTKKLFFGIFLVSIILIAGCVQQRQAETRKIGVVVSILPQSRFVERIGGDKVQVTVMVPPGASPHTYEPTPSQLVEVSKAKMYAKVGSPVEFELVWMDKIVSANKEMIVVDCSKGVKLMTMEEEHEHKHEEEHEHEEEHHHHEGYDPHTWLSPKNAKIMVENIYQGLIQVDPTNQDYYAINKEAYLKELELLDKEIEKILSGKNNRKFMVYHPAWGYFARDYNLEQIPIEAEGKEPTAQGIENLIEQAKKHKINVIFASTI